jgi:hypothetical protein
MTVIAKEVAETSFKDPPKSPMGVLVALTITTSFIVSPPLSRTIDFGNPSSNPESKKVSNSKAQMLNQIPKLNCQKFSEFW